MSSSMEIVAVAEVDGAGAAVNAIIPPKDNIDALPYADREFEVAGAREAAAALVQMEMRNSRPNPEDPRIPPLPESMQGFSPIVAAEIQRISEGKTMPPIDMSKTELPTPDNADRNNIQAWIACVDNARAQLEHQKNRLDNLELMSQYGSQKWKLRATQADKQEKALQVELTNLSNKIQEINWQRKSGQTEMGTALYELETQWGELVSKNFEIVSACQQLEAELALLQQNRRQQLEAEVAAVEKQVTA
eukprot:m.341065 g.341065  ORF g.341065 m.341065 type:complete len:248 (-) comp20604_c0_seq4:927-1670(-)